MTEESNFWAVIPAGGSGRRMAADKPKQYLKLLKRTVLEHSLLPFCEHPLIRGIAVVVADDDEYWPTLALSGSRQDCHGVRRQGTLSFRVERSQAHQ